MSSVALQCHPATPPFKTDSVDVDLGWQAGGRLWLRFHATCELCSIELPDPAEAPARRDNLWKSTCFELFLRDRASTEYLEFNFSPSRHWAAYRFDDYREGQRNWPIEPPEIHLDMSDTHVAVEVTFAIGAQVTSDIMASLSAVIHESGDRLSYWALSHPPGKPDFHHKDCFALQLTPPERP